MAATARSQRCSAWVVAVAATAVATATPPSNAAPATASSLVTLKFAFGGGLAAGGLYIAGNVF